MFEWMKKHKIISIGIIMFSFLLFIIVVPLILNTIYYLKVPCNFFKVGYNISDILGYYGATLTFIGTVSLGIVTIYQNHLSQKKTDEVNKLTLELQKKSMEMAEQNYEKEKLYEANKNTPKFELRNSSCNGHCMNLIAVLKNVSGIIVSGIKSVSFEVFDGSRNIVTTSDKVKIGLHSLLTGQETNIEFHNTELEGLKRLTMVWSFQCEDIYGNIHYYKAKLNIEDSNNFKGDYWRVEKVG